MTRRESIASLSGLGFLAALPAWTSMADSLLRRPIPSTGESLPAIGVGTWRTFDVGDSPTDRDPLLSVLKNLLDKGGKVIDSSPMYGNSEKVVGELSTQAGINSNLFIATKVWTSGKENGIKQMNESFSLLKRKQIDLMQVHNLVDWKTHLATLRGWKDEGKVRYIGITHYTDSSHETIAAIIKNEPVDFIQVNYNLLDRHAEERLLPYAQEKNVAVIVNRPFEEGELFQKVKGKSLPPWAAEFDCKSWAQFFLKFILSHPAVICTVPGTAKLTHLIDNLAGATGRLPDEKQRQKMIQFLSAG
jgi:diketogulonate reductase-like aldo/keto reductase